MIINYDLFVSNLVTGFSVGIGSVIANYFVQKSLVSKIEKLKERR